MNRDIKKVINGWKMADKFINEEQKKRLPEMSPEESKNIYTVLMEGWEKNKKDNGNIDKIKKMRINEIVSLRKKLDKLYWEKYVAGGKNIK